jgi:formylglycine-generating enzyme required for sulfatase activity
VGPTGTADCVSDVGAFDVVGNLWEWVAEWVPQSTTCLGGGFSDDLNCFVGASTTDGPGALLRGGGFGYGTRAGVFAVIGFNAPSVAGSGIGFRAAR